MKSTLKNMVIVLFSITAISALLVALVNNMTKDAIALSQQQTKNLAKFIVLDTTAEEARVERDTTINIGDFAVTASTVVRQSDNTILGYAVEDVINLRSCVT